MHDTDMSTVVALATYGAVTTVVVWWSGALQLAASRHSVRMVVLLCGLFVAGQSLRRSELTYPFAYWGMYGTAPGPTAVQQVLFDTADGHAGEFPFAAISPFAPRPLMMKLYQLAARCRCRRGDRVADSFARSLAEDHEERTGERVLRISALALPMASDQDAPSAVVYEWKTPVNCDGYSPR
jgi:hypothetical protein